MKFRYLWILAVLFMCCTDDDNTLTVKGTAKNVADWKQNYPEIFQNDSVKLILFEVPIGSEATPVQLDSTYVSAAKGDFLLSGLSNKTGMYDIMIENGPLIPLVNDEDEIDVVIDLAQKEKFYQVSGSPASEKLADFIFTYSDKSNAANRAFKRLDSLKLLNAPDSTLLEATNQKNRLVNDINQYLKDFISGAEQPTVAAFALGVASNTLPRAEFESQLTKQLERHEEDESLQFIKTQFDNTRMQEELQKQQAAERERRMKENSWVGKPAPELVLPDPSGKNVPLSSFRGKYVLVDFWASWCRPCRDENPNVVKAFNEFKDDNFTVLGVSLDRNKEDWLEAIKKDNLNWTHVSDLAFWNSKAVEVFSFDGIPFNVLIDPQGKVIAEGLRGERLMSSLNEILK